MVMPLRVNGWLTPPPNRGWRMLKLQVICVLVRVLQSEPKMLPPLITGSEPPVSKTTNVGSQSAGPAVQGAGGLELNAAVHSQLPAGTQVQGLYVRTKGSSPRYVPVAPLKLAVVGSPKVAANGSTGHVMFHAGFGLFESSFE